jgi:uncharacterized protein
MMQDYGNGIVARLSADLLRARKEGDTLTKEVLQSTLARITNAEAVPVSEKAQQIQGTGVGSTEASRRALSENEIRDIVQEEMHELLHTIEAMSSRPDHPYAHSLRAKAAILSKYL